MTAHVLVVDDLEPNVKLLEAKLRAEYFEVTGANSGEKAIELAREVQPDIILLDVMMPVMDGFETCRRLKADHETCHIPVVMVTALDQQEDRIAGLDAGADDFLTKPVEDVALFARVRSLTRLKMMTDELRLSHATGAELGILTNAKLAEFDSAHSTILVVDDNPERDEDLFDALPPNYKVEYEADTREALEALPGVGRKTANVVLNIGFGQPTIAVDTHIYRVSNRTRLATGKNVLEVERKLEKRVPKEHKKDAHHLLILHGRYTCIARKPRCQSCVIEDLCEYREKTQE